MASITLTPSEQEIQSFLSQYQKALSPSKNPYIRYFLRLPQATVSIYTSGKVLLQGQAAETIRQFLWLPSSTRKQWTRFPYDWDR